MGGLRIARVVVVVIALSIAAQLLMLGPAHASSRTNSVAVSSNVGFIVQEELAYLMNKIDRSENGG
jgi:hypothetical protein